MLISVFASKKTGRIHVLTPDSTGERRSRRGYQVWKYQEARRPTISCDVPQTQVMSLQGTSIHVYNDDQPLERFLSGCSGFYMLREGTDVSSGRLGAAKLVHTRSTWTGTCTFIYNISCMYIIYEYHVWKYMYVYTHTPSTSTLCVSHTPC